MTPLNRAVAAVMVEMHLCAPTAGKEPRAAHLATWDNCRVKEPTRRGSSSGAMLSTPSEAKDHNTQVYECSPPIQIPTLTTVVAEHVHLCKQRTTENPESFTALSKKSYGTDKITILRHQI